MPLLFPLTNANPRHPGVMSQIGKQPANSVVTLAVRSPPQWSVPHWRVYVLFKRSTCVLPILAMTSQRGGLGVVDAAFRGPLVVLVLVQVVVLVRVIVEVMVEVVLLFVVPSLDGYLVCGAIGGPLVGPVAVELPAC